MSSLFPTSILTGKKAFFTLLALFAVSGFLSSCDSPKPKTAETAPQIDPKVLVSCDGIGEVKLTDTYADLEKRFGADKLSGHDNTESGHYTTVWDQQPKQLDIFWQEKSAPYIHIKSIESASADAPYEAKGGLKAGMSVKDILAINTNMPLTFVNPYASTSDAGLITTFNSGQLATDNPCLGGYVDVAKSRNLDEPTLNKFKAEKIVDSTHPLLAERIDVVFAKFKVVAK